MSGRGGRAAGDAIAGDACIGGTDPKKGLASGWLHDKTGGLSSDLLALGGGGKVALGEWKLGPLDMPFNQGDLWVGFLR